VSQWAVAGEKAECFRVRAADDPIALVTSALTATHAFGIKSKAMVRALQLGGYLSHQAT